MNPSKFFLALAPIFFTQAAAAANCAITQDCVMAIDRAKSSINSNIDDMDSNISKQVNRSRVDIIEALGRQTSSLSGQQAKATETSGRHAENMARAQYKIDASASRPLPGCGNAAGSQSRPTFAVASSSAGPRSAGSSIPPRLKKAWDQADPQSPVLPPFDSSAAAADFGVGSCQGFAGDPNSARGKMCRQIEGISISSNKFFDADIKAETLFEGPQQPGQPSVRYTVTAANSPERDARKAIVSALSEPVPAPGVHPAAMGSPEGQAYLGALAQHQAQISLATHSIREFDAETTAHRSTRESIGTMFSDPTTKEFVVQKLTDEFPGWQNEGISPLHLAEIQVEKRVGNPGWYTYMSAADDIQKAAEIPFILAEQQRLLFSILMELKKLNVVAGQQLATQTKEVNLPILQKLAESANKTVRQ